MNRMTKLLAALTLVLALVSPARAFTNANDSSLTWTVSGTIFNLPGSPSSQPFSCSGAGNATTNCYATNVLQMNFSAPDTTHVTLSFVPSAVCGSSVPLCNATPQPSSVDVSSACTANGYVATQTVTATYNSSCDPCFGGVDQTIRIIWSATTSTCGFVAPTTTTTLPPTLSISPDVPADESTTVAFSSLTVFPTKYICFPFAASVGTISMYATVVTTNGAVKQCIYSADGT